MKDELFSHPLQSAEWGEFRKKTGVKVIRTSGVQMTIHQIPHTPWTIGYIPKGPPPTADIISDLKKIGKEEKCIFIQLEPNVTMNNESRITNQEWNKFQPIIHDSKFMIHPAAHPLFTKYTFILDLTKSEEELLRAMHPKTRYNIKVALKHGVKVVEDNSDKAFETYLKLTEETTRRQNFFAHTKKYHRLMWNTLKVKNSNIKYRNSKQIQNTNDKKNKNFENLNIVSDFGFRASDFNHLTSHLFLAKYKEKVLVAWILFVYGDTLYYPYGASSSLHREAMASNLIMWEAIRFGKKLGLKKFDMWGALSNNPDKNDPWYGFHRFKEGYGPKHVESLGSFDLVMNPVLYEIYKILDKIRWIFLKMNK